MKWAWTAVLVAMALVAIACSGPQPGAPAAKKADPLDPLIGRLEKVHFYEFTDPSAVAGLKAEERQTKDFFASDALGRRFRFGKASLVSGGVKDLLTGPVGAFLKREGVLLDKIDSVRSDKDGYTIRVGSITQALFTPEDAATPEELPGRVTAQTIILINKLLAQTPSQQRAYLLDRPDGTFLVFLRPELYAMILNDSSLPSITKPMTFLLK